MTTSRRSGQGEADGHPTVHPPRKIPILQGDWGWHGSRATEEWMTTWQIFISVTGVLYAAAMLFVAFASIRDLTGVDRRAPAPRFCPAGSTCRLCLEAQELEAGPTVAA